MEFLTDAQLKEIERIIEKHTGILLRLTTGDGSYDPALLKKLGIPSSTPPMIASGYVLGKLVKTLEEKDIKNMSYGELKRRIQQEKLTTVEKNSLRYANRNAGKYVTALGRRTSDSVSTKASQKAQKVLMKEVEQGILRDTTKQAILNRQTKAEFVSELGNVLKDWKRDWKRVAHTELWNAKLQGEVTTILQGKAIYSETDKGDTKVFRRPSPHACTHCKRLYLEKNGLVPRIFKLSELVNNGTNVGVKTKDWKPITGTTHPNCTCPLAVVPDGFEFDETGELIFKPKSTKEDKS